MSLLLQRGRLVRGSPVALAKFPGLYIPPVNTGPFGAPVSSPSLPPRTAIMSNPRTGVFSVSPTARSIAVRGVSGSLGSFISGIGDALGGIAGIATKLGGVFGGGPGPTTVGAGGSTGGGAGGTGTATGGCVTLLGQTICGGGSVGAGSGFSTGGGTGISLPGGGTTVGAPATLPPVVASAPGTALVQRGYHLNRRGYYTHHGYVAPHSKQVRNRRRNPLNPRALSHSLHRLVGFQRASSKIEKHLVRLARKPHRSRMPAFSRTRTKPCGCK